MDISPTKEKTTEMIEEKESTGGVVAVAVTSSDYAEGVLTLNEQQPVINDKEDAIAAATSAAAPVTSDDTEIIERKESAAAVPVAAASSECSEGVLTSEEQQPAHNKKDTEAATTSDVDPVNGDDATASGQLSAYEGGPAIVKKARAPRQYTMRSDLEEMMFGFGDVWPTHSSAVDLLESIAANYIEDLTSRAVQVSEMRGKLDKECFLYVVRKDRRLFNRAARLLKAHDDIKSAQKEQLSEDTTTATS